MTTKDQVQNYTLLNIDSSFDAQITLWIAQVQAYIEKATNRSFSADSEASTRLYDGNGSTTMLIDECSTISAISINSSAVTLADVVKYPANSNTKYKLYYQGGFPIGTQNISVTALFGETAPADLVWAATVLVAGIIQATQKVGGDITREKIGNFEVAYANKDQAADIARANEIIMTNRNYII